MSDSARKDLHELVDKVPTARLWKLRRVIERVLHQTPIKKNATGRINEHADELNEEAQDVLGYQADW